MQSQVCWAAHTCLHSNINCWPAEHIRSCQLSAVDISCPLLGAMASFQGRLLQLLVLMAKSQLLLSLTTSTAGSEQPFEKNLLGYSNRKPTLKLLLVAESSQLKGRGTSSTTASTRLGAVEARRGVAMNTTVAQMMCAAAVAKPGGIGGPRRTKVTTALVSHRDQQGHQLPWHLGGSRGPAIEAGRKQGLTRMKAKDPALLRQGLKTWRWRQALLSQTSRSSSWPTRPSLRLLVLTARKPMTSKNRWTGLLQPGGLPHPLTSSCSRSKDHSH